MSETVPGLGLFLVFKDLTEHKTMILTPRKCRLIINMTILAHAMRNSQIDKLLISCSISFICIHDAMFVLKLEINCRILSL